MLGFFAPTQTAAGVGSGHRQQQFRNTRSTMDPRRHWPPRSNPGEVADLGDARASTLRQYQLDGGAGFLVNGSISDEVIRSENASCAPASTSCRVRGISARRFFDAMRSSSTGPRAARVHLRGQILGVRLEKGDEVGSALRLHLAESRYTPGRSRLKFAQLLDTG